MSNTAIHQFVRFSTMFAVLICTVCTVTLASAQDPYGGVELQKEHLPKPEDDGWRLEVTANLEGGIGKDECSPSAWICFPFYGGGGATVGFSPWPAFSAGVSAGLWAYAEGTDVGTVGVEARFRPVQLFRSWSDYVGESMHAFTLGTRADLLLDGQSSWGDFRLMLGYEYRSDFGLLFRLETAPGVVTNGMETQGAWGSSIGLGGYF